MGCALIHVRQAVMESYTPEAYQCFVNHCLARYDKAVTLELTRIFRQSLEQPVGYLEIVIAPDGILKSLPITLFYKDQQNQPIPGGIFSLEKVFGSLLTPEEAETVYRYDENGVETLEVELQILIEWFPTRWLAANGPDLPIPTLLSIRNDCEALNLKEMTWIPHPSRQ